MAQHSKQEKKGTSGAKLVNTTELLEQVLLNLPVRRLFTFQRINRVWHDTIASSHALKRKMWLLARAPAVDDLYPKERLLAPVYKVPNLTLSPTIRISLPGDGGVSIVGNAPISASIKSSVGHPSLLSRISFWVNINFTADGTNDRLDSTWRNTLLTAPAIKAIKIIFNDDENHRESSETIRSSQPLTLGSIYEAYERLLNWLLGAGVDVKSEDIEGRFIVKRPTGTTGARHCVCQLNDDEEEECGCFEFLKEKGIGDD